MERPDLLRELADRHGARDTTVRGTGFSELEAMTPTSSQYNPDIEIPEKSWVYRFAKRFWFNDYGTYGRHFREENWHDTRVPQPLSDATEPPLVSISNAPQD